MKPTKLNLLILAAAAVLAGHANAATIVDPTLASGPGNVIDPAGSETVDESFGTAQATLEARSDLRVLQDFTGFAGSVSGNNIVSFTSTALPDIQFQWSGSFNTGTGGAGAGLTNPISATSGSSFMHQDNSETGTSTLTISFGTFDGSTFTADQTVGAAAFTLTQIYTGKNGTVIFRDSLGNALNTTFSYTGVSDVPDGAANHKDFYFGWDSTAQSTAEIGSISITFTGSAFSSGLDDFALAIPEPSTALLGGLGLLALLRRRR